MSHQLPVSVDTSHDPLNRMRVLALANEMIPDSFLDATALVANPITTELAGQLYAGIASIAANIGEGYSRSSGKERAHIFEYALGSVRECMVWYRAGKPILGESIVQNRRDRLEEMRRLLLAIIPRERGRAMK